MVIGIVIASSFYERQERIGKKRRILLGDPMAASGYRHGSDSIGVSRIVSGIVCALSLQ